MLFPIKLPSSTWMSILLSVSITLSSLVLSSPIPAGSTGSLVRNGDTEAASSVESNHASPTQEQLHNWVRLLRARRFELCQPRAVISKYMVFQLERLMVERVISAGSEWEESIDAVWDDDTLKSMLPYLIPGGVGLAFDDLKKEPSDEMSLEMLECHWEALENVQLKEVPVRHPMFHVPRMYTLQWRYMHRIKTYIEAVVFGVGGWRELQGATLSEIVVALKSEADRIGQRYRAVIYSRSSPLSSVTQASILANVAAKYHRDILPGVPRSQHMIWMGLKGWDCMDVLDGAKMWDYAFKFEDLAFQTRRLIQAALLDYEAVKRPRTASEAFYSRIINEKSQKLDDYRPIVVASERAESVFADHGLAGSSGGAGTSSRIGETTHDAGLCDDPSSRLRLN
ncbi:hypothetical protein SeLEV6574_g04390 [Synchytrium endobioticum]|uniref:Uncharacterized protein n=1 Tax=Synchytrium endobioticum TaxID=286115 RepID=A0A507CZI6_9FUNG|nr:hypothetical protein SeLEV6574_g04390 [Synchytrium endobioticum]